MNSRGWRSMGAAMRMGVIVSALLASAGCVSLGSKPPDQLFSLSADARAPAGDIGRGSPAGSLLVLDPEVDRRLDVNRIPVQIDASSMAYVKGAVWVERPSHLFRRLLAETIRAKSGRLVLEGGEAGVLAKTTLSGRLAEMGYDAGSQSAIVRYDALRSNADGTLAERRFEATVPGVSPKAEAIAPALNTAANAIAVQVADWMAQ
jgi:cholesterol transport system auxiliary component